MKVTGQGSPGTPPQGHGNRRFLLIPNHEFIETTTGSEPAIILTPSGIAFIVGIAKVAPAKEVKPGEELIALPTSFTNFVGALQTVFTNNGKTTISIEPQEHRIVITTGSDGKAVKEGEEIFFQGTAWLAEEV